MSAARHAALLRKGQLLNHYQPVVDLRTGDVLGVEVLGRLQDGVDIIPPGVFLPGLRAQQLEGLLFTSLRQGLDTLAACDVTHPKLFISFNVSSVVLVRRGFLERLMDVLVAARVAPCRIMLEVLESDEFLSLDTARRVFRSIHATGIGMAIDDLGSGYSSLNRLRDLPVDKIKLDRSFVRELHHRPGDLHFVEAVLSLARGLRKELIVEGVETAGIREALGVLGVAGAQGYEIARPMPTDALLHWLGQHVPRPASREPRTLLGAYAAHLSIVEACRAMINQPLQVSWSDTVEDPHACCIGQFFDRTGLHDSAFGSAHRHFHRVIKRYREEPAAWEAAAAALWRSLQAAIKAEAGSREIEASADPGPAPRRQRPSRSQPAPLPPHSAACA